MAESEKKIKENGRKMEKYRKQTEISRRKKD